MRAEATILHADVDAFFASVAQRDDPALRGRPICVGHGVVMAASYEARARGVRGAMGGAEARRLCPDAVFVEPDFDAYVTASRALFELFDEAAPVVEGIGMEEAFLDVRGLGHISGAPPEIAGRLRREVRERLHLPLSVGVARTKVLAKMASRAAKPDGLLVVEPEREREFLHPLPVESLWGVGPSTAQKLRACGIDTVGELAERSEGLLVAILGRAAGQHLHAVANNRDPRQLRRGRRRGSFGAQSALGRGPHPRARVDASLVALVDRVTRRMRKARRAGRTVVLRLRFADYTRATRSYTLERPTQSSRTILGVARALLAAARPTIARRGLTLIGIAVTNLDPRSSGIQLELPFGPRPGAELDAALDTLRERFGSAAVSRATHLRAARRHSAWLLPGDEDPG